MVSVSNKDSITNGAQNVKLGGLDCLRVTSDNPCPICGKPDWCLVSLDGIYAICQREESSVRLGEAGFKHRLDGEPLTDTRNTSSIDPPKSTDYPLASLKRRNEVYNALLASLELSEIHKKSLLARGLTLEAIEVLGYKTLPSNGHRELVKPLIDSGLKLAGVSGFYLDNGSPNLAGQAGILIPIRSLSSAIQGFQLRRDNYDGQGSKYVWLSSHGLYYGAGSGSPSHVSRPLELKVPDKVILTEGALKADIIAYYTGITCVAMAGVSSWRSAIDFVCSLMPLELLLAIDNDRFTNEVVERCLISIEESCRRNRLNYSIVSFPSAYKGLDDYLYATGGAEPLVVNIKQKASLASKSYYKATQAISYNHAQPSVRAWAYLDEFKTTCKHITAPEQYPPFSIESCSCDYCQNTRKYHIEREFNLVG